MLGVTTMKLSSPIAAMRIGADVLEADERTPPEAVARLRALLGDHERAAAAWIDQMSGRSRRASRPQASRRVPVRPRRCDRPMSA